MCWCDHAEAVEGQTQVTLRDVISLTSCFITAANVSFSRVQNVFIGEHYRQSKSYLKW